MNQSKTKEEIEEIAKVVVDAMLKVHRTLGPGLLESTYQACLAYELRIRGIEVGCELKLAVRYGEIEIEAGYRIDMRVAGCIIVENKSTGATMVHSHKFKLPRLRLIYVTCPKPSRAPRELSQAERDRPAWSGDGQSRPPATSAGPPPCPIPSAQSE
jgi:GxxExxY protein